jgi:hypothetical protein
MFDIYAIQATNMLYVLHLITVGLVVADSINCHFKMS